MPTLTIDGKQVTVEAGTSVIEAAKSIGIEIPHYCWHPGLSVAGNCRMCLVEIEKMPKLQIGCGTPVGEGMVVHTGTEKVKRARQGVQEFLFVNHPLDCPVCDQAGECKLQDYYMLYDRQPSRMNDKKTRRVKALPIGPYVVYDAERCIACSRCVRFSDEVSKTSELGIFERGDNYYVGMAAGVQLDNPYSLNTVDICPVGALTSRDFRFKVRVWELTDHNSVCAGCARGCNIKLSESRGKIARTLSRENPQVNKYWVCDDGRFVYKRELGPSRLQAPSLRAGADVQTVTWEQALDAAYDKLHAVQKAAGPGAIAGVSSNQGSNEDAYLFTALLRGVLQAGAVAGKSDIGPEGYQVVQDDILIQADKNPNTKGLKLFGGLDADPAAAVEAVRAGKVKVLVVWGRGLDRALGDKAPELLAKVETVIYIGSHEPAHRADIVLPTVSWAEKDGTFTNVDGVVQRFQCAVAPLGSAKPDTDVFRMLIARFGVTAPATVEGVFLEAAARVPGLAGVTYATLGDQGVKLDTVAALAR
jgi:NADH-quinone oxidoreductase subunit G